MKAQDAGGDVVAEAGEQPRIYRDLYQEYPGKGSPVVSARETYMGELRRTEQLFERVLAERRRAGVSRVALTLLCNQAKDLGVSFTRLEAEEAAERAELASSPQTEVMLARHDAACEKRRQNHEQLLGLLDYVKELIPTGHYRQALEFLEKHFDAFPVTVRTFTARQDLSPVDSMPMRQDVVDISGLRAAGEPFVQAKSVEKDEGEPPVPEGEPPVPEEEPPVPEEEPPAPEDLAENVEIVFTPEITALAASLGNDPLAIFQHVRNKYEFDPYLGSRRGADETRRLRGGNDMDLSSLLIALLRVSGIPARYATGLVDLTPEQAMNWLGVDDPNVAGSILTTAGMEGLTIVNGPDVESIRCRRVWVEAYLPYTDYRGAGAAAGEAVWVPLDPAMKTYENRFGTDLLALSGFDSDAFIENYVSSVRPETVLEVFDQSMAAYAATNLPDLDYGANRFTREIVPQEDLWLPGSLPFRVITRDGSWSEVPAEKRFRIRLHVHGEGATLDHTMELPAIAGKQVTLTYIGATQADRDFLEAHGGVFGVPNPAVVQMKPQLRIDGCVVVEGSGSVTLGVVQDSDTTFTPPSPLSDVQTINNVVIAGNYEGHAYATGRTRISPSLSPDTNCEEVFLGWYLHRLGMQYLDRISRGKDETAALMQSVVLKDVSNAILGQRITVGYIGGVPQTFEWFGLGVDADRSIVSPFSTTGASIGYEFLRVSGADGSLQENRVFEEEIGYEAVSTIKILALANHISIPVWNISSANAALYIPQLNHPASTVIDVIDSVNAGKIVTIPRDSIRYYSWTGTGYIDLDPTDGAAGYIISGGGSGGDTVDDEDPPPGCTGAQIMSVMPAEDGNIYSDCDNRTVTIEVRITSYDEDCNFLGTSTETVEFTPASLGPGTHPFRFGADGDCGGCGEDEVVITVIGTGVEVFDSDGRAAVGHHLEVVVPLQSEAITCTAPNATGEPVWTIGGVTARTLVGKTVSFPAVDWNAPHSILEDLTPEIYSVTLEDCDAPFYVYCYANEVSSIKFAPFDSESFMKFIDALENLQDIGIKFGSPFPPPDVSFGGSVSFVNQWQEQPTTHLAGWTWSLGGQISLGVTGQIRLGTGLLGIPPPLVEAAVFISLGGELGLQAMASRDVYGNFQVEGGTFGSITVGVGGEASIGAGLISITLVAESGIGFTSVFGGTGKPAEVYAQTKIEAGQLDISYKQGRLWGVWESSETWRVSDPWTLFDGKAVIYPFE